MVYSTLKKQIQVRCHPWCSSHLRRVPPQHPREEAELGRQEAPGATGDLGEKLDRGRPNFLKMGQLFRKISWKWDNIVYNIGLFPDDCDLKSVCDLNSSYLFFQCSNCMTCSGMFLMLIHEHFELSVHLVVFAYGLISVRRITVFFAPPILTSCAYCFLWHVMGWGGVGWGGDNNKRSLCSAT